MGKPKTADEGLAEIVLLCQEMTYLPLNRRDIPIAQSLTEAMTPIVRELNDLRLENEKLTAALHRKSEDRH